MRPACRSGIPVAIAVVYAIFLAKVLRLICVYDRLYPSFLDYYRSNNVTHVERLRDKVEPQHVEPLWKYGAVLEEGQEQDMQWSRRVQRFSRSLDCFARKAPECRLLTTLAAMLQVYVDGLTLVGPSSVKRQRPYILLQRPGKTSGLAIKRSRAQSPAPTITGHSPYGSHKYSQNFLLRSIFLVVDDGSVRSDGGGSGAGLCLCLAPSHQSWLWRAPENGHGCGNL
jgi:hypothetical protein